MRNLLLAFFCLISLSLCSSAQGDVASTRGNRGRTGEIDVNGTFGFGSVAWKSPQIFGVKMIQEGSDQIAKVRFDGQKYSYNRGSLSFAYLRLANLPGKGQGMSSAP